MPEPLISNVSDTACWMAAERAAESVRPDALFNDPQSGQFRRGTHPRSQCNALRLDASARSTATRDS